MNDIEAKRRRARCLYYAVGILLAPAFAYALVRDFCAAVRRKLRTCR